MKFLFLTLIIIAIPVCSQDSPEDQLVGVWTGYMNDPEKFKKSYENEPENYNPCNNAIMQLQFFDDNRVISKLYRDCNSFKFPSPDQEKGGKWLLENNQIVFEKGLNPIEYNGGNKLVIDPNGRKMILYKGFEIK